MSDMMDLAERLEMQAATRDMGRKPDPTCTLRLAAKAMRDAEARVKALEEVFRLYGQHSSNCHMGMRMGIPCGCGFTSVSAALEPKP